MKTTTGPVRSRSHSLSSVLSSMELSWGLSLILESLVGSCCRIQGARLVLKVAAEPVLIQSAFSGAAISCIARSLGTLLSMA